MVEKNDAESHEMLQARIDDLQQIYLTIQERELNNIVLKVELANTQNKIKENWQLINKMTNFNNLLGKETDPNEIFQPEPIFNNLQINDGKFTLDEVRHASF